MCYSLSILMDRVIKSSLLFEYHKFTCYIVDDDDQDIGCGLDDDIVEVKYIYEQLHYAYIEDTCEQTAGKERRHFRDYSLRSRRSAVEDPLPVGYICKQYRSDPGYHCARDSIQIELLGTECIYCNVDDRRQYAEDPVGDQVLIFVP